MPGNKNIERQMSAANGVHFLSAGSYSTTNIRGIYGVSSCVITALTEVNSGTVSGTWTSVAIADGSSIPLPPCSAITITGDAILFLE